MQEAGFNDRLKIEVFSAPGCNKCGKTFQLLERVLKKFDASVSAMIDYRLVNIVDELDYAVALGIVATPGIAINGQLVFTGMPGETALRDAIQSRLLKPTLIRATDE
ncbi:MAG: thioredoxin family protein [Gammaproteobacteria bacterium]|nr:thioredoxin family protein [Gammaproteobacteria bacterium]MCF6261395.1 thioredoxin family protein [Gammaproteobacteria bacterium]